MYIHPFVAGIIATVFSEIAGLLIWAAISTNRKEKKHRSWYDADGK